MERGLYDYPKILIRLKIKPNNCINEVFDYEGKEQDEHGLHKFKSEHAEGFEFMVAYGFAKEREGGLSFWMCVCFPDGFLLFYL